MHDGASECTTTLKQLGLGPLVNSVDESVCASFLRAARGGGGRACSRRARATRAPPAAAAAFFLLLLTNVNYLRRQIGLI
jgi:hypothetical protein